jgi:hypothetical protein
LAERVTDSYVTVAVHLVPGFGSCTLNTKHLSDQQTSTRDNSTTMDCIDKAIADLKLRNLGDNYCITTIARYYGVERSRLSKRWRGVTRSKADGYAAQQALTPQQEYELVLYIEHLTSNGLPPTRPMIQNFASTIAKTRVSEAWVTRFIHRN